MKIFLTQTCTLMVCLLLVSCGSKVSPTVMADEILAEYSEMSEAMVAVKDVATAKEAAETIRRSGEKLHEIASKSEKLDEVTEETRQRNRLEFIKVMDEMLSAKDRMGRQIASDKEALRIMIEAFEAFEEKEQALQGVYQHLGLSVR